MKYLQKIAEILYHAYEKDTMEEDLSPEGYDEAFKKFIMSLDKNQEELFYEYEAIYLELLIAHETRAIRYVLELLEPNLADL